MPQKWDQAQHEKLLFSVIETQKVDWRAVSQDLKTNYGNDQPTAGAIEQHIGKLKKKTGLGTPKKAKGGIVAAVKPRTPISKTPNAVKTPTSSKRKAGEISMSEEDDTELDTKEDAGRRVSLARRTKSVTPGRFVNPFDSADDGDAEIEVKAKRHYLDSETEGTDGEFAAGF